MQLISTLYPRDRSFLAVFVWLIVLVFGGNIRHLARVSGVGIWRGHLEYSECYNNSNSSSMANANEILGMYQTEQSANRDER
jgi:hypothetical protein